MLERHLPPNKPKPNISIWLRISSPGRGFESRQVHLGVIDSPIFSFVKGRVRRTPCPEEG